MHKRPALENTTMQVATAAAAASAAAIATATTTTADNRPTTSNEWQWKDRAETRRREGRWYRFPPFRDHRGLVYCIITRALVTIRLKSYHRGKKIHGRIRWSWGGSRKLRFVVWASCLVIEKLAFDSLPSILFLLYFSYRSVVKQIV